MSERDLREIGRAQAEELSRLSSRVSELSLRSWRGAMRTAGPTTITPGGTSAFTVLRLDAPPGRWEVHISGRATGPTVVDGKWGILTSIEPVGSADPVDANGSLPAAEETMHWVSDTTVRTLLAFGWVAPTERFSLALQVTADGMVTAPLWADLKMMMLPW